jgi:hypothetical protein
MAAAQSVWRFDRRNSKTTKRIGFDKLQKKVSTVTKLFDKGTIDNGHQKETE